MAGDWRRLDLKPWRFMDANDPNYKEENNDNT